MSRRDEQLRKEREKNLVLKTSQIYCSSIAEVLYEAEIKKEDIDYLMGCLIEKVENLNKGYIDLDTYVTSVEEKTGITLH